MFAYHNLNPNCVTLYHAQRCVFSREVATPGVNSCEGIGFNMLRFTSDLFILRKK